MLCIILDACEGGSTFSRNMFKWWIEFICMRKISLPTLRFREDTTSLCYYIVLLIYRFTADTQNVPLLVPFIVVSDTKMGGIQQAINSC